MKLPASVARQGEQSEAMIAQIRAQHEAAQAPEAVAPEPAPAAPVAPTEPTPPKEDWKAKYHTLKGKYDAEVPRLSGQVRDLTHELRTLRERMQAAPPTPAIATPDPREQFDPALIDAVQAMIEKRTNEAVAPVAEAAQRNEFEAFIGRIQHAVPAQAQIDLDPRFEVFMSEFDEFSGLTRQQLLEDAVMKRDAQRVVNFYNAFLKSTVTGANPPPVELPPPPAPAAPTPPAPIPAQTGAPGAPSPQKVWRAAEVSAFYSSVSKGHYRGRESEAAKIEADIIAANREGRVRP